jgi:tetratricopeptide (TPR) repeat protein/DNA-binding CsgD family transcriptional regulator
MDKKQIIFLSSPFEFPLNTLQGLKFSSREIDILSCFIGSRTAKKIASLLSLSPRTVENYIRNLMLKIECNSKDGIMEFIENSDQFSLLQDHYKRLRLQAEFEKNLKEIAILTILNSPAGILLYDGTSPPSQLTTLQDHLKMAGLRITGETLQVLSHENFEELKADFLIYVLSDVTVEAFQKEKTIKSKEPSTVPAPKTILYVCFKNKISKEPEAFLSAQQPNYYFSVFDVLKHLIPSPQVEALFLDFRKKYEQITAHPYGPLSQYKYIDPNEEQNPAQKRNLILSSFLSFLFDFCKTKKKPLGGVLLALVFASIGIVFLKDFVEKKVFNFQQNATSIRSDLLLPSEEVLLDRPDLMTQIEEAFKGPDEIRLVALVGIGGAGKTTLARKVALTQTAPLIWEVHAETKESVSHSFEDLAQALAKTEEEKKNLRDIQKIKVPEVRDQKILTFVKNSLKTLSHWFLIYDNMENIGDVLPYIPQKGGTWGRGKVLVTTRNSHIQDNPFVHIVLPVDTLTAQEKLDLFAKIMGNKDSSSATPMQGNEVQKLLEDIPPFPLDVSVAAYYLKATHISPATYRDYLTTHNPNFIAIQHNILHETGEYLKTRYGIITLSLQELIKFHKDFEDLLILIALLDSQQIPRSLLEKLKDPATVDRFLYQLKQYSLMSYDPTSLLGTTFSLHRSTQKISHAYVMDALSIQNDPQRLDVIAQAFEVYLTEIMNKKYFQGAEILINHINTFLSQERLSSSLRGTLGHLLGRFYCYLGERQKAKEALETSLAAFEKANLQPAEFLQAIITMGNTYRELGQYEEAQHLFERHLLAVQQQPSQNLNFARGFVYLGVLYKEMGKFKKAQDAITQGVNFYEQAVPRDSIGEAWAKGHLGLVCQKLGNYHEAQALLEQTLAIHKKHLPENHKYLSWVFMCLGEIYEDIGEYAKARSCYEEALSIYKKQPFQNPIAMGWIFASLGSVDQKLDRPKEAQAFLEKSLAIHQKNFPDHHIYVLQTYLRLGIVYQALHQPIKAKDLFEKVLKGYERHYGKDHLETAWILRHLGQFCLHEHQLKEAENFLAQSLTIFQKNNHPRMYFVYEDLADLSRQQSLLAQNEGKQDLADSLHIKANSYLQKAYEGMKIHFPSTSAHLKRVQSKLKKLEITP